MILRKLLKLWMRLLVFLITLLAGGWSLRPALAADVDSLFNPSADQAGTQAAKRPSHSRPVDLWMTCVGLLAREPTQEHPRLKLVDARFVSPQRIGPGGSIKIVAHTNLPVNTDALCITLVAHTPAHAGEEPGYAGEDLLRLWDDGRDGDAVAHDGELYCEVTCDLEEDLIFTATAKMWFDNYKTQTVEIPGEVYYDAPEDEEASATSTPDASVGQVPGGGE